MEYVDLEKAILRSKNVQTEEIIDAVTEYIGATKEDIERAMMPLVRLFRESDKTGRPIFCTWRPVATSQCEGFAVMKIAHSLNGIALYLTYLSDIFSKK